MGLGNGQAAVGAGEGPGGWDRVLEVGGEGKVGAVHVGIVREAHLVLVSDQMMLLRCLCSVVGLVLVLGP